ADTKAAEFMKASPYKDKLGNAGLFLHALELRGPKLPNLLSPHLGNLIIRGGKVPRMTELMSGAPALEMKNTEQSAALPLGSRLRLDSWDDHVEMISTKPAAPQFAREKIPFEVAPVFLYLKRQGSAPASSQAVTQ